MSNARATRYRRLAMAEKDPVKAQLLHTIADEAERGILVTSDLHSKPVPVTVKNG